MLEVTESGIYATCVLKDYGTHQVMIYYKNNVRKKGYEVGILDADITGPSIPKMFGVHGPAMGSEMGILPIAAEDGTKIMSINLLMEDEEAPVLLSNGTFAASAEGVTASFGLPAKGEMDPTGIMAACYVFLFGLMLSDAAY